MKALIVLLDGVGVGELPDAAEYNDAGSNTLGNLSRVVDLHLPNFTKLGLGNIIDIKGVPPVSSPLCCYGKMAEKSKGKDSTTGHWEIMGVILEKPFPTFPQGFPREMLEKFERAIGRKVLGGYPASGTEIIKELGEEHMRTGYPIVYTSADSVFQIAAHKDVIPLEELYKMCEIARKLFPDIGRVIARPFVGEPGNFTRTPERKDYALPPPEKTVLEILKENGIKVITIGKVDQIFCERGVSKAIHTKNNRDGMEKILKVLDEEENCLIFANLIDFDMLWGHRNDCEGFARGLEEVDRWLPDLLFALKEGDLLIITSDHGNDPTTPSTDHSREYALLLAMVKGKTKGKSLGVRECFCDVGATICKYFDIEPKRGKSFLDLLL